jgi:hypothetical protein
MIRETGGVKVKNVSEQEHRNYFEKVREGVIAFGPEF